MLSMWFDVHKYKVPFLTGLLNCGLTSGGGIKIPDSDSIVHL